MGGEEGGRGWEGLGARGQDGDRIRREGGGGPGGGWKGRGWGRKGGRGGGERRRREAGQGGQ